MAMAKGYPLSNTFYHASMVLRLSSSSRRVILLLLIMLNLSIGMTGTLQATTAESQSAPFIQAQTIHVNRGPTVNQVTNSSALIFWRTDMPTNSTVEYGLDELSLTLSSDNSIPTEEHRVRLTGLSVNTTYHYRAVSNGTASEVYHFKTAPADGEQFKIIMLGDNRPDQAGAPVQPEVFEDIIDMVIAEEPHIVIITGDFVYEIVSSHEDNLVYWEHFTNISDRIAHYAPVYGIVGNHDVPKVAGANRYLYFLDAFEYDGEPSVYYSFDYAGVHFTMLNSEEWELQGRITGVQYDWLVNDLQSTTQPMKFVFAHRPIFPFRHVHSSLDVNVTERDRLQQLFEDMNVTLFGCGHDHLYNRLTVNGVVHVITGGAGAPPYYTPWGGDFYHYVRTSVQSSSVHIQVVKPDMSIADEHIIPDTGPIEIQLRIIANNSERSSGSIPVIHFSRHPATVYYSWASGANSTELTGLPEEPGNHTLDVYAEDDEGVWSHAHYVFTTSESAVTTTTDNQADLITIILLVGGIAAVVIIVVIVAVKRK